MREDFDNWWSNEGQHSELCGEELCLIAWSNAEYKATYPTKTLTDEEIWELHQEYIDEVTCGHNMKTVGFIEFARAILRKAQEK